MIAKFILAKKDFDDYQKVLEAFCERVSGDGRDTRRVKEANLFVYGIYNTNKDIL